MAKRTFVQPVSWVKQCNLNTADIDQIDAMFRKARRWGIASVVYTYEEIAADADTNLVRKIVTNTKHILYRTVPEVKCNERYELRNNNRSYNVVMAKNNKFRLFYSKKL